MDILFFICFGNKIFFKISNTIPSNKYRCVAEYTSVSVILNERPKAEQKVKGNGKLINWREVCQLILQEKDNTIQSTKFTRKS